MKNTPLDAPAAFIPDDEDRPAGEWMEGYWKSAALWSKRLAFATWAYLIFYLYLPFRWIFIDKFPTQDLLIAIVPGMILWFTPIGLLSYFCFHFGQRLENSIKWRDQLLLENAFLQLRHILVVCCIVGCIKATSIGIEWYATYHAPLINEQPFEGETTPVQSEE